jgi:hypothetical protein
MLRLPESSHSTHQDNAGANRGWLPVRIGKPSGWSCSTTSYTSSSSQSSPWLSRRICLGPARPSPACSLDVGRLDQHHREYEPIRTDDVFRNSSARGDRGDRGVRCGRHRCRRQDLRPVRRVLPARPPGPGRSLRSRMATRPLQSRHHRRLPGRHGHQRDAVGRVARGARPGPIPPVGGRRPDRRERPGSGHLARRPRSTALEHSRSA